MFWKSNKKKENILL